MIIAIRKEPNGSLYMDKEIYSRTETLKLTLSEYIEFKKENPNLEHTYKEAKELVEIPTIVFNEETQSTEVETTKELVHFVYVTKRVVTDEQLSQPPYNYIKVEIDDKYSDCQASDFNDNLTFSTEKYTARKQEEDKIKYKREVERLIALRYDLRDELAIQRQQITKPEEYKEYYDYVELCKQEAKNAINQEQITESVSEECENGNESGQEQETSISDCLLSKEEIQMIINDESL